jgi:hypothetical protein
MGEELGDDAEAIGLEAMNGLVVGCKTLFEKVGPHAVQLAEALADHTVKLLVGPFLAGALDDHGCEFVLEAMREVDAHELVTTFFEAAAALDGEVYGSAKVDEVGISLILDVQLLLFLILLLIRRCICVSILVAPLLFS